MSRREQQCHTKFSFGSVLPPAEKPLFEKKIIMLGRPPNRIDLLREISAVSFEAAWSSRESGDLDGLSVQFISCEMLIQNKQAAGRDKDAADVKMLQKCRL
jgi:hypothetical protein